MSIPIVRATAARIAEHATAHQLRAVRVVLHGGEPLLLGVAGLRAVLTELRRRVAPTAHLDLRIQSNGVLLSPAVCDLFSEFNVQMGVSLDGDAVANDRHRRYAHGGSSYAAVRRALALLRRPEYRHVYAGILCTVDIQNDPIRVYQALAAEEPPHIDFLLPHATWDNPPPRPPGEPTPYASWLTQIHAQWLRDGQPFPIRLFDSLQSTATGGPSGTEAVGLDAADLAVVETDGSWEQADSLKTAYDGAAATGFDVFRHSVDEVFSHPGLAARQVGLAGLCRMCQACPVVRQCGGGLLAHRYRSGTGFDNRSVYCDDLKELVVSINAADQRSESVLSASGEPSLIPADVLDEIGTGHGEPSSIAFLAAAQLSATRAIVSVAGRSAQDRGDEGLDGDARIALAGWELLQRLDVDAADSVRTVLRHPYIRAWATAHQYGSGKPATDDTYLACLAAAAAMRAGITTDLVVPVRAGAVLLPTVGRLIIAEAARTSVALSISAGSLAFRTGTGQEVVIEGAVDTGVSPAAAADREFPPAGSWQPTRYFTMPGLAVRLEDTDPYRDCHEWPVAGRADNVDGWRYLLAEAWEDIRTRTPRYAPTMSEGLRAVVPLVPDATRRQRSSAARQAFGTIAAAPVDEPAALAVLLVHEMQHVKLGALLDLCVLVQPLASERIRVPWRPDPRPIEAALQGTYAHLAVADLWRSRYAAATGKTDQELFHRYRDWTSGAIGQLLNSGRLTSLGERFVARMRTTVDGW